MNLKETLTVLVNSCDDYSDVWPFFFSAINEFWPNREIKILLKTKNKTPLFKNNIDKINFYNEKQISTWGNNLIASLKVVETDFVLLLFDDFILEDYIDELELKEVIIQMQFRPDIAVVYLNELKLKTINNEFLFPNRINGNKYSLIDDKVDYKLNSAPAVWRVSDLINFTKPIDNPWSWEAFGTYRTIGIGKKFYCLDLNDKNQYNYNAKKGGGIYRGKWVREVVFSKNQKYKLNIDLNLRGFTNDISHEKKTLKWKINFLVLGFKSIKFKVFIFIFNSIKSKWEKKLIQM